jgi:excisionase family DNA binding protein|tara:strand:+ start:456 stop:647 length:192 start_codon:yes stop_codon:yes gene_type:complete
MNDYENQVVFTVTEMGKILGIGRNAAYNAVSRGDIPVIRLGRRILISKVALDKWLAGDVGVSE